MKLVEIATTLGTKPEVTAATRKLVRELGKTRFRCPTRPASS